MASPADVRRKLDPQYLRVTYPDDPVVLAFADRIDDLQYIEEMVRFAFDRAGFDPKGWGITDMNVSMHVGEPVTMGLTLIHKTLVR